MKRIGCLIILVFIFFSAISLRTVAQETEDTGDIVLKPTPKNKDGIFKGKDEIQYKLHIQNNTNQLQTGRISYVVTTDEGKKLGIDSIHLSLRGGADKELNRYLISFLHLWSPRKI